MKRLNSICLVTANVPGLRDFYQAVLGIAPDGDGDFVTFTTPGANLSIFSAQGLAAMAPNLTNQPSAGSCFLEFEVEDVDVEHECLKRLNVEVIKPPTTQPWGLRSVWFCDPDGNRVNFYARLSVGTDSTDGRVGN